MRVPRQADPSHPSVAATGLSYGISPTPQHAENAVAEALERAGLTQAASVLLFLTPDYAGNPAPALRAAARAAGCTQVVGCTGAGLITEREWILDSPGAAALVLGPPAGLEPISDTAVGDADTLLSFASPLDLATRESSPHERRIGAVSADLFGHGPFAVWAGARANPDGIVNVRVRGLNASTAVASGVRALNRPTAVVRASGPELQRLGGQAALTSLFRALPAQMRKERRLPVNRLMCGITMGDPTTAVREGRFRLDPLVSTNTTQRSITLVTPLDPGQHVFWALRDRVTAEQDMGEAIDRAGENLGVMPEFALLFPCMSRGPAFYGHEDRDLDLLRTRFPGLPIVGFYGNGEIAPGRHGSQIHQYAAVVGLFARPSGRPRT